MKPAEQVRNMRKSVERDYPQARKEQRGKNPGNRKEGQNVYMPECRLRMEEKKVMMLERGRGER